MTVNLAVIYYSATGTIHALAHALADGATHAGASVRIRQVPELAPPEAIDANPAWAAHVEHAADVPTATMDDLEWADALAFGTPTRFGNVAAQLKQFLDRTGPLWARGAFINTPVTGFTSAANTHGGQESTLLALYNTFHHWGALIVSPGYTDPAVATAGGNPYGTSTTATGTPPAPEVLAAAAHQGRRLTDLTQRLTASTPFSAADRTPK